MSVLARSGARGLTHRAVDAAAGLPDGSTSNCFRSRAALVEAIVARLEELDRAVLTTGQPTDLDSPGDLAAHLAANVKTMTSGKHVRATRARIALLLDDTAAPALRAGHLSLLGSLESMLAAGGHDDSAAKARAVSDLLEGALIHAVTVRSRRIDVTELTTAIEQLLSP